MPFLEAPRRSLGAIARFRPFVFSAGTAAYVAALALYRADGRGLRAWSLGAAAVLVAWRAAKREQRASALAVWGLAITIGSVAAAEASAGLDAAGCIGALTAACAARWALSRIVSTPSLAKTRTTSPWPAIAILCLIWAIAFVASAGSLFHLHVWWARYRGALSAGASGLSGVVLLVSGLLEARRRELEMGVTARVAAAMGLLATVTILATASALIELEEPERIGRVAVAVGSLLVVWVALHGDGARIAMVARRVLVLSFVGGTVALFGAGLVGGRLTERAFVVMLVALATLAIGAAGEILEQPLRPMRGAWIDAADRARELLLHEDPEEAVRRVLLEMRAPIGGLVQSPELWTFAPTRVATIDAAGYFHERDGELANEITTIAAAEPEATLRAEVLRALEVRRPDLRALSKWMEARDALSATVVTLGGEPEGLLVLTAGPRNEPMALEEARAIKRLADALAAVCQSRGRQRRALEREQGLAARADDAEEEVERLRHALALHENRHALAATRLARPATVGVYAVASRLALDAIERRTEAGATIAIVAPSGVDPVPFLARAHLAGPRKGGPFVLVDGTSAREHDVSRWNDPAASPLAIADGGTLVLLDGAALPADIQRLVARALSEKRPPWERADPLDIALAFTAPETPHDLLESGRLEASLATRLGDTKDGAVVLPRLRDRPEDLRAILTDRLAREGMRVRGTPVGIEASAYARLVEHVFPGEDAELAAIVRRLVDGCRGDVVRAEDVDALGLFPQPAAPSKAPPRRGDAGQSSVPPPSKRGRRRA